MDLRWFIGIVLVINISQSYKLSSSLISQLHNKNFFVLALIKTIGYDDFDTNYWYLPNELGISHEVHGEWNHYMMNLKQVVIVLLEKGNSFSSDWNEVNGRLTTKTTYKTIVA